MAPDQEKAVKRWVEGAHDALDTAQQLFKSKKYHHALFFCHLSVEKALKARFIALHDALPPYIHDLPLLASKLDNVLADRQPEIVELNTFNIAGRYQEEKLDLYHRATPEYTQAWLEKTVAILKLLI